MRKMEISVFATWNADGKEVMAFLLCRGDGFKCNRKVANELTLPQ